MLETRSKRKLTGGPVAPMLAAGLVAACGGGSQDGIDGVDGGNGGDGGHGGDGGNGGDGGEDAGSIAAPEISDIDTQGSPALPGEQVEVSLSASGDALSYDWTLPEGWSETDNGEVDAVSLTAPDKQAAEGQVSVTVENSAGSASSEASVVTHGPAIEEFSADVTGDTATLSVSAYNRDSRDLAYDYRVAGTLEVQDQGSEWSWSAAMGGLYALQTTVRDSEGLTAEASAHVTLAGVSAWPTAGGSRQRSGREPRSNPPQASGTKKWDSGSLLGGNPTAPALGPDGTLYVGSADLESGDDDTNVYALDPVTGNEVWTFTGTGDDVFDSPSVGPGGTVYVGSKDNNVYALDPDTGTKLWDTAGRTYRTPSVGRDGTVYVGHNGGVIQALDPGNDGNEIWSVSTGAIKSSLALAADGTIYGGDFSGTVYALDPSKEDLSESERTLWTFNAGNNASEIAPALGADGTIYVADHDFDNGGGTVYALDPSKEELSDSERILWSLDISKDGGEVFKLPYSLAVAAGGTVYAGFGDTLYALDPSKEDLSKSERIQWSFTEPDGDTLFSSPALSGDGTLYVGSEGGKLFAIDTENQEQAWSFAEPAGSVGTPALAPDGTIYVNSTDNKVYAIE